jgi:8-amino-7-oxononanoate synthase
MRRIEDQLEELESQHLRRRLRPIDSPQGATVNVHGRSLVNFSSNDYLGLAASEPLRTALHEAIDRWGVGAGASRLVCGTQAPHADLEARLAEFKGTGGALTFTSGYAAAVGIISSLLTEKSDIVILDKLCHASLIDGSRLSGATMRVFPHNHLDKLDHHLQWARNRTSAGGRILIVTEAVFSMDGDRAPLTEIIRLKEQYGALLLLDEAHSFGVIGPGGRGLAAEVGAAEQVDFHLGTLSKAAGLSGGFIAASRPAVDLLINRARPFIYSTAPPPAVAATAIAAIDLIASDKGDNLRATLWKNIRQLSHALDSEKEPESAILPRLIGDENAALQASQALLGQGFLAPAIRYPTVARGEARLRFTANATHLAAHFLDLHKAMATLSEEPPPPDVSTER